MKNQKALWISSVIVVLAMLTGCGGGGTGGSGGSGGGSMTSAQRVAALDAVATYYGTLPHTDPDSDNQALDGFLKTRQEFEASGVSDDSSVWARFRDGRMFVFANNREPAQGGQKAAFVDVPAEDGRSIPTSRKAYAIHAMGSGYGNATSDIAGQLLSKGYNVTGGVGLVSTLKNVKGAGVFYMDTHGGKCLRRDAKRIFALGTAERVDPETEQTYKEDLDAGRLVYMAEPWNKGDDGKMIVESHYAFTADFVRTYMDLGPNSLVYMDACSSFDDGMIAAVEAKGATTYLGWDDKAVDTDALRASRYFFDHVLGTNMVDPPDPPQRPFDVVSVYNDMVAKGMTVSIGELRYASTGESTGIDLLAPTIARLAPVESTDTLYVSGSFGENPGSDGKVTIGGVPAQVTSWDKQTIACVLPSSGPGSAGDVVVEVRGHTSNVVQLTEWRPTFKFTFHSVGTIQYSMTIHAHIRGDAHTYRWQLGEEPRGGKWPYELAKDSTATIDASGSYTDPVTGTTFTCEINGPLDVPLNGAPERTFEGSGNLIIDPIHDIRTLRVGLNGVVADAVRTTVHIPDGSEYSTLDEIRFGTATLAIGSEGDIGVDLDPGYGMVGDWVIAGQLTFEWANTPAAYPPDPNAARRPRR